MSNLQSTRTALAAALTRVTAVPMWDYWGLAPDADFPVVGLLWPDSIDPMGSLVKLRFEASAAFWSIEPEPLWSHLSSFTEDLGGAFGPNSPCLSELAFLGLSASLTGPIRIGLPNSSAASSTGPNAGGVWVPVNFTLELQ